MVTVPKEFLDNFALLYGMTLKFILPSRDNLPVLIAATMNQLELFNEKSELYKQIKSAIETGFDAPPEQTRRTLN